jgi:xylan 1,4-beta-xylosidase
MKKMRLRITYFLVINLFFTLICFGQETNSKLETTFINVDFAKEKGSMKPIWAWWGYDEPNYTYMKDGKKLLSEIAELSSTPVYVRAHSLMVTDDGPRAALKWGSTNMYTEDENGNPIYSWTVIDRIFDTYIERGMKPMAQIGFMPKALSSNPEPYRHHWKPGAAYNDIYLGWTYPPKDYKKWAELVYQWVKHSVERYGKEEVESWYWELWNEPNIGYWRGTTDEYIKLYDYTADAVKRALPTAIIGGPEVTGPEWDESKEFFHKFMDHVVNGKNYVTGKVGSPLDFITFHAKGNPRVVNGVVQMDMGSQLRDIDNGFKIVASYPTLKDLPIVIGESDPEGCAACSQDDYPHNAYRNGTMYASYTAASFARKYDLADFYGVNLLGAVTWGFEFEDQKWFAGFRDMATNGVDKPVLNVFRMFGMMRGNRVEVSGDFAYDFKAIRDNSVRGVTDINALAAKDDKSATVMVWNYHDDNILSDVEATVEVKLTGLPDGEFLLHHYRVDETHSNSYTVWLEMGAPQQLSRQQTSKLEDAGQLKLLSSPKWIKVKNGEAIVNMKLPRQGVSLLKLAL